MGRGIEPFRGSKHWWVDLTIGATLIWMACLGLDAVAAAHTVQDAEEIDRSLATALVAEERARVERLAFERLEPTNGFVPPAWIAHEGLDLGEIGLLTRAPGPDGESTRRIYSVTWKVEHVDRRGSLRRATVSVHWKKSDGRLGRVVTSVLRAGGHTA